MEAPVSDMETKDEYKLAEMGYRQDLKRDWTMLHNFGVSFSIIVCLPYEDDVLTLYDPLILDIERHYRSHDVCISLQAFLLISR